MKKVLSMIVIFALVLSLAACGNNNNENNEVAKGNENSETTGTVEKDEKSKITVWAWDPNFNVAIMEEAKAKFNAEYPNVEIEIVDYAKADLEQKLHTDLAAGTTKELPDIVLVEDYNAQMYLQAYPGAFADLTGLVNHGDFVDYKTQLMTLDSKVYGVPFDSGVAGFYYRSDILAEAGYEAADLENITWDEWIVIAQNVYDKTGTAMLAFDPNDGGLMRIMMQSAGQWYFDEAGAPFLAENEALNEAVRIYKEIGNSNFIKLSTGWGEWVGAFNSGDTASVVTGVWITGSVKAEASQSGLWAVAPVPRLNIEGSVNASNLGGSSWYVLDSSKEKDAAILFLNETFAKDVDLYQEILIDRGAVGSFKPSQSGDAYTAQDEFFGGQELYSDMAQWMTEIPAINFGTFTYEADAAIFGYMGQVYSGGSIKDALKQAEDQLKSQLQ